MTTGVILFKNGARSTLAGAVAPADTSIQLATGGGALFPAPGAQEYFVGTLMDQSTGLIREIVNCTAVSGDTLTVVRAQEGTTALSWAAGDIFASLITAGVMQALIQQAQAQPARVITLSGVFALTNADGAVALNRTTSIAVSSAVLPPAPINGQEVEIADLAGNFQAFPVTITPNAGQGIANLSNVTGAALNVNRQVAIFKWYSAANLWSFKP